MSLLWLIYTQIVCSMKLEKYTFSDERVSEKLNKIKLIKFDITETLKNSKYLQSMMVFGAPALFSLMKMVMKLLMREL